MRKLPLSALLALLVTLSLGAVVRAEDAKPTAPAKQPWLWLAEGEGTKLYLLGTIHLPHEKVRTLPDVAQQALAASDAVFVEVKPSEMQTPDFQKRMLLPEDKKLTDLLPADVQQRMNKYMTSKGIPPSILARYRPWAISTTLTMLDHLQLLAMHPPMDQSIYDGAVQAGQEARALETASEQIAVFEAMNDAAQAKFLADTLTKLEEAQAAKKDPIMELIDAYAGGEEAKLLAVITADQEKEDEEAKALRKRLLDDRNVLMVDRALAEAMKRPGKTLFVAVGAAHHLGEKGIVKLLEAKGLKVRRVLATEKIAPRKKELAPSK